MSFIASLIKRVLTWMITAKKCYFIPRPMPFSVRRSVRMYFFLKCECFCACTNACIHASGGARARACILCLPMLSNFLNTSNKACRYFHLVTQIRTHQKASTHGLESQYTYEKHKPRREHAYTRMQAALCTIVCCQGHNTYACASYVTNKNQSSTNKLILSFANIHACTFVDMHTHSQHICTCLRTIYTDGLHARIYLCVQVHAGDTYTDIPLSMQRAACTHIPLCKDA
jgi:hypothetical protein